MTADKENPKILTEQQLPSISYWAFSDRKYGDNDHDNYNFVSVFSASKLIGKRIPIDFRLAEFPWFLRRHSKDCYRVARKFSVKSVCKHIRVRVSSEPASNCTYSQHKSIGRFFFCVSIRALQCVWRFAFRFEQQKKVWFLSAKNKKNKTRKN